MTGLEKTLENGSRPSPPHRWPRWFSLVLLAAYWICLFAATHAPAGAGQGRINDKVLHFSAYAILGFLLAMAATSGRPRTWAAWLWIVAICALYGAADELLQIPVPGRMADVFDFVADCGGAILGSAMFFGLMALASGRQNGRSKTV